MAKQHLLLVDGDASSLRVMEVSLKKAGFSVTTAIHGRDASEKVQISSPDLVLTDTAMPEMDGFELCKLLKGDERFRQIPFVFLTQQGAVELKIRGLELGADAYLTKPLYIEEIVARIKMILQKGEKERTEKQGGFSGNISEIGVVDLVQTFESGRKSGTLKLLGERAGVLYFSEGKVVDAEFGRLKGESAFYRMLNVSGAAFEVQFAPGERPGIIECSTQALLMEGMRRLDEWERMLEQLPALETAFEIDYRQLAERLSEIPDEVNGILRLFDGKRSLAQVVDDSDFEDLAALGIISKLYFEGLIREAAAAAPAAPNLPTPGIESWLNTGPNPAGAAPALPVVTAPPVLELAPEPPVHLKAVPPPLPAPILKAVPSPRAPEDLTPPVATNPFTRVPAAPAPAAEPPPAPTPAQPPAVPAPAQVAVPPAPEALRPAMANVITFAPKPRRNEEPPLDRGAPAEAASPADTGPVAPPGPPLSAPPQGDPGSETERARAGLRLDWNRLDGEGPGALSSWAPVQAWSPSPAAAPVASEEPAPGGAEVEADFGLAGEPLPAISKPPIFGGAAAEPPRVLEIQPPQPAAPHEVVTLVSSDHLDLPAQVEENAHPEDADEPEAAAQPAPEEPAPKAAGSWISSESEFFKGRDEENTEEIPPTRRGRGGWAIAIGAGVLAALLAIGWRLASSAPPALPPPPPLPAVSAVPALSAAADPVRQPDPPSPVDPPPAESIASPSAEGLALAPVDGGADRPDGSTASDQPAAAPGTKPGASEPEGVAAGEPAPAQPEPAEAPPAGVVVKEPGVGSVPGPVNPELEYARLFKQAKASIANERFKTAVTSFRRALALKPESTEAKAGLGISLVMSDTSYREAVRLLEVAVRADDKNARAWLALGMAYQNTGRDTLAWGPYRKYLMLEPNGPSAEEIRTMLKANGQ